MIEVPEGAYGAAYSYCFNNKVDVTFVDEVKNITPPTLEDYQNPRRPQFSNLIKVMYHELGHDILNLAHTCVDGDIMFSSDRQYYGDCDGETDRTYTELNPNINIDYNYDSFIRGRNRMFNMVDQIRVDCREFFECYEPYCTYFDPFD